MSGVVEVKYSLYYWCVSVDGVEVKRCSTLCFVFVYFCVRECAVIPGTGTVCDSEIMVL